MYGVVGLAQALILSFAMRHSSLSNRQQQQQRQLNLPSSRLKALPLTNIIAHPISFSAQWLSIIYNI